MKRQPGGQPPLRIPIAKASQTIKLAATLGGLDMSLYGVSPSIAATMDKAVKVSGIDRRPTIMCGGYHTAVV